MIVQIDLLSLVLISIIVSFSRCRKEFRHLVTCAAIRHKRQVPAFVTDGLCRTKATVKRTTAYAPRLKRQGNDRWVGNRAYRPVPSPTAPKATATNITGVPRSGACTRLEPKSVQPGGVISAASPWEEAGPFRYSINRPNLRSSIATVVIRRQMWI